MPTSIELALQTLLPTVSFLPTELLSLANSLLAQSRAKAASLKAEEEIGRPYACAHIACERYRKKLDLEVGKPRPPVNPKVYNKLYKYLDSALNTPGGGRTPTRREIRTHSKSTPRRDVETPSHVTPSRKVETVTASAKRKREEEDEEIEVPEFVQPLVRTICKALDAPSAVPHVLVGARAVVAEIVSRNNQQSGSRKHRRTPQSAKSEAVEGFASAKWPALVLALSSLTASRMKGAEREDVEEKAFTAIKAFCKGKQKLTAKVSSLRKDMEFYLLEAEDCGWLDMEWYQNIPEGQEELIDGDVDMEDDDEIETPRRKPYKTPLQRKEKHGGRRAEDGEEEEDLGAAGLLPGLGTMFQPAVDWLSDERRRDYAQWKKGILREIAAIEQEQEA